MSGEGYLFRGGYLFRPETREWARERLRDWVDGVFDDPWGFAATPGELATALEELQPVCRDLGWRDVWAVVDELRSDPLWPRVSATEVDRVKAILWDAGHPDAEWDPPDGELSHAEMFRRWRFKAGRYDDETAPAERPGGER